MHGFNKAFMADPGEFLTKQPLRVQGRDELPSETWPLAVKTPPIHLFDLKLVGKHVELIPFTAHASGNPFARQRPIKAYWLDYFPTKTVIIAGDMGLADFLFTPMLSGCYIGGNATGMVHVAGDVKREAVKGELLPPRSLDNMAMRLRATNAIGPLLIGFDSNHETAAEMMTLVGVRKNAAWTFYVQGHDGFRRDHLTVLKPVYAEGAAVIKIDHLRHA